MKCGHWATKKQQFSFSAWNSWDTFKVDCFPTSLRKKIKCVGETDYIQGASEFLSNSKDSYWMEIGIDSITAWVAKDDIRMRRRLRKTCKTQNSWWGCLAGEPKNWIWSLDFDTSCHHRSGACDISNFSSKRRTEVLCCDTPHVCNTRHWGRLSFSSRLVTTPILAFKLTTNSITTVHHSTSGLGWESSTFGT